jgi:hypothetical protein
VTEPLAANQLSELKVAAQDEMTFQQRHGSAGFGCYCPRLGSLNSDLRCGYYQTSDGLNFHSKATMGARIMSRGWPTSRRQLPV